MHTNFKVSMIDPSKMPHRTVHKVNKEPLHSTATCTTKPEVPSIFTNRVHSSEPIAKRIAGPLNKRGWILVGLLTNKTLTEYH